jgi:hypothetical protein
VDLRLECLLAYFLRWRNSSDFYVCVSSVLCLCVFSVSSNSTCTRDTYLNRQCHNATVPQRHSTRVHCHTWLARMSLTS